MTYWGHPLRKKGFRFIGLDFRLLACGGGGPNILGVHSAWSRLYFNGHPTPFTHNSWVRIPGQQVPPP